jgi:hypothetical protein
MRPVDDMNFDSILVGFYKRVILVNTAKRVLGQQTNSLSSQSSLRLINASPLLVLNRTTLSCSRIIGMTLDELSCDDKLFTITVINPTNDTVTSVITSPEYGGASYFIPTYFTDGNLAGIRYRIGGISQKTITVTLPPRSGAIFNGSLFALTGVTGKAEQEMNVKSYPQPFTERTTLEYRLERASNVVLRVFDVLGREVWRQDVGMIPAGTHETVFSGENLPQGTYFCALHTDTGVQRIRLVKQ